MYWFFVLSTALAARGRFAVTLCASIFAQRLHAGLGRELVGVRTGGHRFHCSHVRIMTWPHGVGSPHSAAYPSSCFDRSMYRMESLQRRALFEDLETDLAMLPFSSVKSRSLSVRMHYVQSITVRCLKRLNPVMWEGELGSGGRILNSIVSPRG